MKYYIRRTELNKIIHVRIRNRSHDAETLMAPSADDSIHFYYVYAVCAGRAEEAERNTQK